ncbi:DUF2510 domain-containing protein [Streptomyces sp. NBC_01381]|uniref:DUF2510 domain-containing protein n=1 Tax=Streptomyces sp. NBC_01381 TaxID=2903845 RepID=UPI0022550A36|nr:DUF2510 domain-containing protein [Streptomyces sp. NBC_01381]MCX4668524.1 DUF2510 domain-containing protein [Streptomyces sp. NBC_01381]
MSMSPPPGWYADPSAQPAQHVERWWDGSAWTEHRRTPEAPHLGQAQPGFGPPTQQLPVPSGGGGGRAKVVALAVAGVVLVASIVTGAVVLGGDDGEPTGGDPAPTTSEPVDTPSPTSPTPTTSAPDPDPSHLVDQLNGITIPVLDGWEKADNTVGSDPTIQTPDTYDCPGEGGFCRHGTVYSRTATATDERSPKALALGDIKDAADRAYDQDAIGRELFGGITRHEKVKEGSVAVAGRSGYLVRWRVYTAKGPGGYVQSLAFPSSLGSEAPVIVRFAIDAGDGAPPLADLDKMTKGIRTIGEGETSGGVGNSVGATP